MPLGRSPLATALDDDIATARDAYQSSLGRMLPIGMSSRRSQEVSPLSFAPQRFRMPRNDEIAIGVSGPIPSGDVTFSRGYASQDDQSRQFVPAEEIAGRNLASLYVPQAQMAEAEGMNRLREAMLSPTQRADLTRRSGGTVDPSQLGPEDIDAKFGTGFHSRLINPNEYLDPLIDTVHRSAVPLDDPAMVRALDLIRRNHAPEIQQFQQGGWASYWPYKPWSQYGYNETQGLVNQYLGLRPAPATSAPAAPPAIAPRRTRYLPSMSNQL